MYEIIETGGSKTEKPIKVIKFTDKDGLELWVPIDESNSDYQAYLLWLEENK